MYHYALQTSLPVLVLANKADKIAPTKVPAYVEDLRTYLSIPDMIPILPFSSEKKIYSSDVWNLIEKYITK